MSKPEEHSVRTKFLQEVDGIINNDRAKAYGTAENSFTNIANLWNAYLQAKNISVYLNALDVALMMDLMKTARLATNLLHKDSWIDKAGYSACGGGIVISSTKDMGILSEAIVSLSEKAKLSKEVAKEQALLYTRVTENREDKSTFGEIEEGYKGRYLFQILGQTGYFKSVFFYTNQEDFPNNKTYSLLGYTEVQPIQIGVPVEPL